MATKFYMLCGLPASGKSTYAQKLVLEEQAVWLSSDNLRLELFGSEEDQEHNSDVFAVMQKRAIEALSAGKIVIYDAQNINSKRRKNLISLIKRYADEIIAVVFATPYEMCLQRNNARKRRVPEYVIFQSYLIFTMPCLQEGFDTIKLVYPEEFKFRHYFDVVQKAVPIAHDNPHHLTSIGQHMLDAAAYFTANFVDSAEKATLVYEHPANSLYYAVLLHDIGKPATKVFLDARQNKTEIAHYYNHNNVGAYEVLLTDIPEKFKPEVALLIQYHMQFYISWNNSEKALVRDTAFLGQEFMDKLSILHTCDLAAH